MTSMPRHHATGSRKRMFRFRCPRLALAILACLFFLPGPSGAADFKLASDTLLSNEGYLVLTWQTANRAPRAEMATLLLQQASSADFSEVSVLTVPLSGSHTVTGLANGEYFFRVGTPAEGWSNSVSVTVMHHSLLQAWTFFALGLLLFLTLACVIFAGARNVRGNQQ